MQHAIHLHCILSICKHASKQHIEKDYLGPPICWLLLPPSGRYWRLRAGGNLCACSCRRGAQCSHRAVGRLLRGLNRGAHDLAMLLVLLPGRRLQKAMHSVTALAAVASPGTPGYSRTPRYRPSIWPWHRQHHSGRKGVPAAT